MVRNHQAKLRKAISLERTAHQQQLEKKYARVHLEQLERQGLVLAGLRCDPAGSMAGERLLRLSCPDASLPRTKFSIRDSVRLSRYIPSPHVRVLLSDTQRNYHPDDLLSHGAVVVDVNRDFLLLSVSQHVHDVVLEQITETDAPTWRVDEDLDDRVFRQMDQAVQRLGTFTGQRTQSEVNVRFCLLGLPGIDLTRLAKHPPSWMNDPAWRKAAIEALRDLVKRGGVNESQKQAIAAALTRSVSLWQGPPGTGKTTTITALMQVVVTANRVVAKASSNTYAGSKGTGPVLAVAGTNAAVDNMIDGLVRRGVPVVRLGHPARARPELRHLTLEAVARASPLGKKAAELEVRTQRAIDDLLVRLRRVEQELENATPTSVTSSLATRADTQGCVDHSEGEAVRNLLLGEKRELVRREKAARRQLATVQDKIAAAKRAVLLNAPVLVSTCSGSTDRVVQDARLIFPLTIVDESAQIPEPQTWIALVQGAQSVVLAGDPRQLPPTVLSRAAGQTGLDVTLFDRLVHNGLSPLLLDVQYRMHPSIVEVPSALFYHGKLTTGVSAASRPAIPGVNWPVPDVNVILFDVEGRETRNRDQSWLNTAEVDAVWDILAGAMRDERFMEERPTVAVLTPYAAQARALQKRLMPLVANEEWTGGKTTATTKKREEKEEGEMEREARGGTTKKEESTTKTTSIEKRLLPFKALRPEDIFISTVDAFQGREADLVVVSTVRSRGILGFVADPRRMNVALTRARRGVVVVGNRETLRRDRHWGEWVAWVEDRGCARGYAGGGGPHARR